MEGLEIGLHCLPTRLHCRPFNIMWTCHPHRTSRVHWGAMHYLVVCVNSQAPFILLMSASMCSRIGDSSQQSPQQNMERSFVLLEAGSVSRKKARSPRVSRHIHHQNQSEANYVVESVTLAFQHPHDVPHTPVPRQPRKFQSLVKGADNSNKAFYKELVKVVKASDIILEVLDVVIPLVLDVQIWRK